MDILCFATAITSIVASVTLFLLIRGTEVSGPGFKSWKDAFSAKRAAKDIEEKWMVWALFARSLLKGGKYAIITGLNAAFWPAWVAVCTDIDWPKVIVEIRKAIIELIHVLQGRLPPAAPPPLPRN